MHVLSGISQNTIEKSSKEVQESIKTNSVFCKYPTFMNVSRHNLHSKLGSEDYIKFLVYPSTVLFHVAGVKDDFIKNWSKLAKVIESLDSKKKPITVGKVIKYRNIIREFVENHPNFFTDEIVTIKLHYLVHYCEQIISDGPPWAKNGSLFEGSLKGLKIPGMLPTTHIVPAMSRYIRHQFSLNLFSPLEEKTFEALGIDLVTRKYIIEYISKDKLKSGEKRGSISVNLNYNNESVVVSSFKRYTIHKKGCEYVLCPDSYSKTQTTNNQYILLKNGEYAKILAIEKGTGKMYYQRLSLLSKSFFHNSQKRIAKFPLKDNSEVIKGNLEDLFEEQCFGCEIDHRIYCIKIK